MDDSIQQALVIGEIAWALRCAQVAIKATRKSGGRPLYDALRLHAELMLTHADDTDLPDLARAATAWSEVTRQDLATAEDFAALAWSELLAFKPKKAKAALEQAQSRAGTSTHAATVAALARAVAWAQRRKDGKRLVALEEVAATCDDVSLERIVRLLVQADVPVIDLADRLAAQREKRLVSSHPDLVRAVRLRVSAHRSVGEPARAAEILATWVQACSDALPDASDVRRYVLDMAEGTPGDDITRAERRVQRVTQHLGALSPALEQPLALLGFHARLAGQHAIAVDALQKLEALRPKSNTTAAHELRCDLLMSLYKSLTALRHFDEALAVIERYEQSKARLPLHLVPDHHARAEVYEAMGDHDRMVAEHLAAVAQYAAAPPPVYGPTASNTRLARGWARMALVRAGRHAEAMQRFPED